MMSLWLKKGVVFAKGSLYVFQSECERGELVHQTLLTSVKLRFRHDTGKRIVVSPY